MFPKTPTKFLNLPQTFLTSNREIISDFHKKFKSRVLEANLPISDIVSISQRGCDNARGLRTARTESGPF